VTAPPTILSFASFTYPSEALAKDVRANIGWTSEVRVVRGWNHWILTPLVYWIGPGINGITNKNLTGAKRREFSGMIPVITSNVIIPATPSNPSIPYV
jgi:hypothetical protein